MSLSIKVDLQYSTDGPTDVLLQFEAAHVVGQTLKSETLDLGGQIDPKRVTGESGIGTRFWLRPDGDFSCVYNAVCDVTRPELDLSRLSASEFKGLSADVTRYLLPSRYCDVEAFESFVDREFGDLEGGRKAIAIRDWCTETIDYVPGTSDARTTASDTFLSRQGICRDYAHVFVTMCRAAGLPARFVSCYAPDVTPPDFHAVAEVWLEDSWHLVDASAMSRPSDTVVIGVGHDAAEVAFMTIFGQAMLKAQTVEVTHTA